MRLDDDAKLFVWYDFTLSFDPTGSTVGLDVDGTRHPMEWQATPVEAGSSWTQTAKTTERFCGTAATAGTGDVALTAGRHMAQAIVTPGDGQVVPAAEFAIDVK